MLETPSLLVTIVAFLLVLGPLVLIHELGHYLVARWCGVKADAFSIGFGREIAGLTDRRGTRWKLSVLPLGGYVQFAGDMNAAGMPGEADPSLPPERRAELFQTKPLWQRTLIVLAGPLANLLAAIAIFAAFNLAYGKVVAPPEIAGFAASSTARDAGMRIGDRIVAVNGEPIDDFTQVPTYVLPYPGRTLDVMVRRDGREFTLPLRIAETIEQDRFGNKARLGRIGVKGAKARAVPVGPVEAVTLGTRQTFGVMQMMATGIGQIFTGERSVKELGGPIKIAQYSGEQMHLGWEPFVGFAALISINLAFINLLPIPGLDGGHLAFYAAEAVRRKPLGLRSQEWALRTGLAFVLGLMLIVTINDIASLRLFGGG